LKGKVEMKRRVILVVASVAIVALAAASASATDGNLLLNGSFEEPIVPWGTWEVYTSVPGWDIQWADPPGDRGPELEIHNHLWASVEPYHEDQYVELDSYDPTLIIQQGVPTTPGCSYELGYAWRPRPAVADNQLGVYVDGVQVRYHSADGTQGSTWSPEAYTFQAAASSATLGFAELGFDDQLGMFLDAVSLVELPCVLAVDIDIKPQSIPNCFNNNSHGVIPVAILGSADFDVSWISLDGLSFGGLNVRVKGNDKPQCSIEDVSGNFVDYPQGGPDGHDDLVCQFVDDAAIMWDTGTGYAAVTGDLLPGYPGTEITIDGSDLICLRPE
jgi:hypothetical protein